MNAENENHSSAAAAVEAGRLSAVAEDRVTTIEGIPVALVPNDMKLEVGVAALKLADERAPAPRRRLGKSIHTEIASFIAHVNRFKDADSVIFANTKGTCLGAVYDYNKAGGVDAGGQRWGQHQAVYTCPKSRQWELWTKASDSLMSQEAFGEFIEANMADLASPDGSGPLDTEIALPADVLSMARNLVIRTKGEFSRTINPTTGEGTLVSKLDHESTSTKIPKCFLLKLPVFEDGTIYRVEARVRFSMRDGKPSFAFTLFESDVILRDAFGDVRKAVETATGLPMFAGSPE